MSYEDLEEHNVFLPEDVWGEVDLSASVSQPLILALFLLGAGSCVMMLIGDGAALTWMGALLYVVFLYGFMFVSNRGIAYQNKQINELVEDQPDTSG